MHVIFVHGWSVTNTETYGDLPRWLQQQSPQFQVQNVYLGKYVSFVDTVTLDDIARAFDLALDDALGARKKEGFACITHSTGGPLVRLWMQLFYEGRLADCPMKHLVMLAPANHGSALAQLGKGAMARFKYTLFDGVEPGVRVLDWLELGSEYSWTLNEAWLDYDCVSAGIYPFVLTGQRIERSFYDHLNSYTGEAGSDGVVRVAGANLNYGLVRLHQDGDVLKPEVIKRRLRTGMGVLPGLAHSGDKLGIIRSVKMNNASRHVTARWVLRCLQVASAADYNARCDELDELTRETQKAERVEEQKKLFGTKKYYTSRYAMLVFRFLDDRNEVLTDYDLYITGGPKYNPDDLPPGFFVDRQRNKRSPGKLTYYVDYDVLRRGLNKAAMQGRIGFKVVARPQPSEEALAFYKPLSYESDEATIADLLRANETLMVEIKLQRCVDARVCRIEDKLESSKIEKKPLKKLVPRPKP